MRVLFDEGVPAALRRHLPNEHVDSIQQQGWEGVQNGKLLRLIEEEGYDVFITADKNMSYQQTLLDRPFAVLVLSTNHWPTLLEHVAIIALALSRAVPGSVAEVDCGRFPPKARDR